jgi:hypothetical protein
MFTMSSDDDELIFPFGNGCMLHGEDHLRECAKCGTEFCSKCHKGNCCEECSTWEDEDPEDEMGEADPDVEALVGEVDDLPPDEELADEEEDGRG